MFGLVLAYSFSFLFFGIDDQIQSLTYTMHTTEPGLQPLKNTLIAKTSQKYIVYKSIFQ